MQVNNDKMLALWTTDVARENKREELSEFNFEPPSRPPPPPPPMTCDPGFRKESRWEPCWEPCWESLTLVYHWFNRPLSFYVISSPPSYWPAPTPVKCEDRTGTHTNTRMYTQTHTWMYKHIHTKTHIHGDVHTHKVCIHMAPQTRMYTHIHTHTVMHTHTHIENKPTQACIYGHTHKNMC